MKRARGIGCALIAFPLMAAAERAPQPPRIPSAPADQARVIVAYKHQATLLRQFPLTRGAQRDQVDLVMQSRAQALTRSARVPLTTGRAFSDRMHVIHARGISSQELVRRLSADADVAYAVPDGRKRALMIPNDPLYAAGPPVNLAFQTGGPANGQWYLKPPTAELRSSINAPAAWDLVPSAGGGVVVAVLDTGVLSDHQDLIGRVLPGRDLIADLASANDGDGRDNDASDAGDWITSSENQSGPFANCGVENSSWHGTRVAGIIGAATNNGLGMAGIAHGAQILPVRVLGKCGGVDSDIIAGMLWAAGIDQPGLPGANPRAQVLNMSLGSTGTCSAAYRDAVARVNAAGAVVVAAAGNSAGRAVGEPANCPGMIAVAGLRHAGSKVGFSDLGPEIAIAAPGGNCVNITPGTPCLYPIVTTTNLGTTRPLAGGGSFGDSFNISVGTSFATPIVAGVAALVIAAQPSLTPAEVRNVLQATARPFPSTGADNGPDDPTPVSQCTAPGSTDQLQCYCTSALCGAGMVDAQAATAMALQGLFARINVLTVDPRAGSALQLSSSTSLAGAGRSIVGWNWALVNSGGIVNGFSGATNAATAALQPSAAGNVTVRLSVTDSTGRTASADLTVAVAAAAVQPPAGGGGSSSGGGAAAGGWLLALLALGIALGWARRSERR